MEYWVMLGIEATKDEEKINAAYHEKLMLVHPEEHPEEFMQLRAAYEEAIKYARQPDENEAPGELSPVDVWVGQVKEVYDNIRRRIDPEEWKKLLADDVCIGIDTRLDARDALLKFCMDCFYMPCRIWQLLEDEFSFKDNREELYERFPKDYIDGAVIGGTEGEPVVPYELFAEDTAENPDPYIRLYFKARDERRNGNFDACAATIEDMKNSGFEHPYTRLAQGELHAAKGEKDEAVAIACELAEEYPECTGIRLFRGEMLRHNKEDFEAALADYEFIVSRMSDHVQGRWGKAECLFGLGMLEEAKDIYLQLHQEIPYDENITKRVEEVNNRLVEQYEKQIEEHPDDFELRMDYSWSCLQRREHDKAKALIADAHPETIAQQADFENFSTKLHLNCEETEEGLRHARIWESLIPQLPEGETEKEKKRKGKTSEVLYLQAAALCVLEQYDEALEKADASQAADPTSTDPYDIRRRIYNRRREYEKAVAESEKIVEMNPSYVNWFSLAYDQYNLGDKAAAYHSVTEALNYGKVLQAYIFRARILCDFDEWEAVQQAVDYLVECGIPEDQDVVRYLKARIAKQNGDSETALKEYYSLIELIESGESNIEFGYDIYLRAADIEDDNNAEAEKILALADKGIADKEDHLPLLDFKSYMLWKLKRLDEQMELNKTILELYPKHRYAHERIGDVLYDEHNEYEQALEHYLVQEGRQDSAPLQEVIGLCLMYLERYDEAEPHFKKAIEMDEERLRPRANLGLLYERQFDFERSRPLQLENVKINLNKELGDKRCYRWLARTYARLGRHADAAEAYKKNLELYGESEDARHMVEVTMESGDFDLAEKLLEQYNSRGKIGEPYLNMLADIRKLRGRRYVHIIKQIPDEGRRVYNMAMYYYSQRKYAKAVECFEKLDQINPDRVDGSVTYARCLKALGREEQLKKAVERGLKYCADMEKHGWRRALYLTHKAFVLIADGQAEEAKKLIDRALAGPLCDHCRYSRCKDAYSALGDYYRLLGDFKKALEAYREALSIAPDDLELAQDIKDIEKEHKIK